MTNEIDLNAIIDYRFLKFEAELLVLYDYSQAVERQMPLAIGSEFNRLEEELSGYEEYERHMNESWMYEYTQEVLPRFFRTPILIALWAIFESAVHEIAFSIQKDRGYALKPNDLRGKNDFDKYQKYYEHVLGLPLVGVDGKHEYLVALQLVRHALAHCNGRIEVIKPDVLQGIRNFEKIQPGISTDREFLTVTAEFIQTMIQAVKVVLEDIIQRARENTRD